MAAASPLNGNPDCELKLNVSGTGGSLRVTDAGSTVLLVGGNGEVRVTGEIRTAGATNDPLTLSGSTDSNGTYMVFRDGVHSIENRFDVPEDEHQLYTGYRYRLKPFLLRIDSNDDQVADGKIVEFYRGGDHVASFSRTGTTATLEAEGTSKTMRIGGQALTTADASVEFYTNGVASAEFRHDAGAGVATLHSASGLDMGLSGERVRITSRALGATPTIATFSDGVADVLHIQRDTPAGRVTIATGGPEELELNTSNGAGFDALRFQSNVVQVIRPINGTTGPADLMTFNSQVTNVKSGVMQAFDFGKKLRFGTAAIAGRELHLGWDGRSVMKIPFTSGDASVAFLDPSENANIVFFPDESNSHSGRDARVQIGRHGSGTDRRGRLTMQYDGDLGAPGVLELRADDGASLFLSFWRNTGTSKYELWGTTNDPGTTKPTGPASSTQVKLAEL